MIRKLCVLAVLAGVVACAPVPVRTGGSQAELLAAQSAREAELAGQSEWQLSGRLAVSANGEGGSGRIEWRQRGEDFDIRLSAPVTGKSWTLVRQDGVIVLDGLEGGPRRGDDAEVLLQEATGWRIPVSALAAWARGGRASGPAQIEFGPDGLPQLIGQQGWQVEYREWDGGEQPLPRRVFAQRDADTRVRLVVESWGE
jgi:outer membrane lipoprotein LolB